MADPILIAKGEGDLCLLPQMANRHGLVAGATGTGKTVSMQVLAEGISQIGVPVFAPDGRSSGIAAGGDDSKVLARVNTAIASHSPAASPVASAR
jgi:DNA helicase HerA-like ATPase